jgi:hypothetical protein
VLVLLVEDEKRLRLKKDLVMGPQKDSKHQKQWFGKLTVKESSKKEKN